MLDLKGIAQALFNSESTSDLILVVDDVRVYVHTAILCPASEYIRNLMTAPLPCEKRTISIDQPTFDIPAGLIDSRPIFANSFYLYLQFIYRIIEGDDLRKDDVLALAVIADFMGSDEIVKRCDALISEKYIHVDCDPEMVTFLKHHGLTQSLNKLLQSVAKSEHMATLPILYRMDPDDFLHTLKQSEQEIMHLCPMLIKYVTLGCSHDSWPLIVHGDDMIDCLKDGLEWIIGHIQKTDVEYFLDKVDKITLHYDNGKHCNACFIYKHIAERCTSF